MAQSRVDASSLQLKRACFGFLSVTPSTENYRDAASRLDSSQARDALVEARRQYLQAIAELDEARRVRPEQLNAPITL